MRRVGGVPFVVEGGEDGWGEGGAEEEVPFGVVDFAFWREVRNEGWGGVVGLGAEETWE